DSLLSNLTKVSCVSKIVLVDDSSEDDTLEKCVSWTHNPGVIAVSAGTPPSNWGGKSYACYIGASMCEHDWILFLDADTRMDVDAVGAALGYCSKTGAEAVSVSPQLVCPGLWDKVATPFYSFLLNSFIKMSDVNSQSKSTSYFYGSFMMFKAESYWRIGGHAAVATDLVEDRALGSLAKRSGLRVGLLRSDGKVRAKWAPGFRPSFNALVRVTAPSITGRLRVGTAFIFALSMLFVLPYAGILFLTFSKSLAAYIAGSTGLLAFMVACASTALSAKINRVNPILSLLFPVGEMIYLAAMWVSVFRVKSGKRILWRNRTYVYHGVKLSSERVRRTE
ncbi:MAG: glycosyltransferase family 2 protein, partial [Thermoprotei archaeon]